MTSSQPPEADALVKQVAEDLCAAAIASIAPVGAGGNNRLFCVKTQDGARFALKSYLLDARDRRDRLQVEASAFRFLHAQGVGQVPAVLGLDAAKGFALYQWIDGEPVSQPVDGDVEAALDFIESLKAQSAADGAQALPDASEACLSGKELLAQLDARTQALQKVRPQDAALADYLDQAFKPVLARAALGVQNGYRKAGMDFDQDIPADRRTLSPSDFGFHNALRVAGGGIVFVDFEYFGWDDPVKITADFLLHPAMTLSAADKTRFSAGAQAIFGADSFYVERLRLLFPLYGLRWCLIVLNEFLAEKWSRRHFADSDVDQDQAKQRQLKKANTMLDKVRLALEKEDLK